ncbi:sensor histidine kinase [Pseudonocardia sp. HH130630-07]|uniref:sensor histidine kinase n=1 Tax=Pseudonocardia sp. HH130630-07 TaxID=1690815 RepID=UPI000839B8C3|nr:HAMP domain-containing sensor histidine kinase [Pseudonocardia sp. HH130630-07]
MRERTGVRAASALAAATAVAMVLVVAGVALVLVLEQVLAKSTRDALEETANQLVTRVDANFVGDPKDNAIDATGKRTDIVQVVTAYSDRTNAPDEVVGSNGRGRDVQVLGASDPLGGQDPIVGWLLAPRETRSESDVPITYRNGSDREGADETVTENMMVVGIGARVQGRPITVYAAQDLGQVHKAVETVGLMLVVGVPILVLVAGFFTYLFAGRALRPVEEMRARVAGMGERDLSGRVPEPAARDEVGRLARTMNQMLGRLESSQATQRRFVADASHELRSPLATVSTGLELLGAGMGKDSADRATVETLRGETSRLTGLVEGLLFLARADERGIAPRREEVDLDEIADAERARPAGASAVVVRVVTEPARVVGDRGQLVRVVRNLVDNARRHAASAVTVAVRISDGTAVVDVDDDGNGVPEADRARVFERFVRLDEARSRGDGGSGLGLSIVSELVAAHGGAVSVLDSPELGGARFRVTLPAVAAPAPETDGEPDADGAPAAPVAPAVGAEPTGPADATDPADAADPGDPADAPLRDDRPSGPLPRIGAVPGPGALTGWAGASRPGTGGGGGAARPGDVPERPTGDAVPVATPIATPGVVPGADAPAGAGGRAPGPAQPVRPDAVGSPYDENATRPLPVVRAGAGARSATATAPRAGASPAGAAPAAETPPADRPRTEGPPVAAPQPHPVPARPPMQRRPQDRREQEHRR